MRIKAQEQADGIVSQSRGVLGSAKLTVGCGALFRAIRASKDKLMCEIKVRDFHQEKQRKN